MNKKTDYTKIMLILSLIFIFIVPFILKIDFVRNGVSAWLSFSNNPDYKIAYIQLIGSIAGTFLSVYGALYIQKEQQRMEAEVKKQECAQKLYIELRTHFRELQSMFYDTKIKYNLNEFQSGDVDKFCDVAVGRKLSINERWVENLAGSGTLLSAHETNTIYQYYCKLQVIQSALETKSIEKNREVYVPYVCWFITMDGKGVHSDIEHFMQRLGDIAKIRN